MNYKELNQQHYDTFLSNLDKNIDGVMTGFQRIDKATGGLRKGTMAIIGARPSTGKTAFALNIACNQLYDTTHTTIFFSLEMSAQMILERVLCILNGITYKKFSNNSLNEAEKEKIGRTLDNIKDKLIIVDNAYNADEIAGIIQEYKPTLAIVDFIQNVTTKKNYENPRHKIDYISNLFKRTAKETDCILLVLSQLRRQGKEIPTMSDLKESGGLEQDGDYIIIMHRDYVVDKRSGHAPSETTVILDKNKFGVAGQVKMNFDLEHQKFCEVKK